MIDEGSAIYFKPHDPDNPHPPEYPATVIAVRPNSPDVFVQIDWEEAELSDLPELTYPDGRRMTTEVISCYQIVRERIDF